jgi:hypothetical protein
VCIHAATQTQKPARPNEEDQINATYASSEKQNNTKEIEY